MNNPTGKERENVLSKVELKNITKSYDSQKEVLSNIDVTIEEGEFFVLVGPSGCGKSTMLRMIAGLEQITSGELWIGDTVANDLPPVKRHLSMVFQNYALYPHLTVEQNIAFGLDVKKIDKNKRKEKVDDVAKMLGLEEYLKRKPRELSGGQRQRVALARAIVSDQPICLMDEPLSNLDAKLRTHMRAEIRRIQRQFGITMIYVTHDQVEAMTMGDRIMILHNGEIQQIGTPIEIYNQPANPFVATFIGTPAMNLAEAVWKEGQLDFGNELIQAFYPAQRKELVTIGVRPEQIRSATVSDAFQFTAVVDNVEVLGTETLFMFTFADEQWTVKWPGQWQIPLGETIQLTFDREAVTVFDRQSGELLKPSEQTQVHEVMQ